MAVQGLSDADVLGLIQPPAAGPPRGLSDAEVLGTSSPQGGAPPVPGPSIARGLGLGVRDVLQGAASLPAAALDLVTWPGRAIQRAAGIPTTAPSDLVTSGLNAAGLPQPQTPGEQTRSTFSQGAAAGLPTMGLGAVFPALNALAGPIATAGDVAKQAIMGGAGAVTGEKLSAFAPDWLKPYVGMAASMLGAYGTGRAISAGGKVANAVAGKTSPLVDAYDRLGMDTKLLGDVTGSPTAQGMQAYSSAAPVSSAIVAPVERNAVSQFGDAVEGTAQMLGTSRNATMAGDVLQNEARNWKDVVFPQRQQQVWTPVDQIMAGTAVDPSGYRGALSALTGKLAALPETQKALLPPRVQTMLDAINADVPAGSTMTWQQAQDLRTAIGHIMGVPEIVQSVGKDQLKAAYGGIAGDMKATAVANGAGDLFDNANAVSTAGHAFIDNTLSKIIRANNPAQESIAADKAADTVLASGDAHLQAIRQEMPRAADELAAYKLRDMALATAGKAGATGGETSVATFLTDLNKLRQAAPNGTAALYGAAPDVAQRISDLSTVADSIRETARRANTSGTGSYLGWAALGPLATEGYMRGGLKGMMATTAAPLVANSLFGAGVTNPAITRFAATPSAAPVNTRNALLAGAIGDIPGLQRRQGN